MFLLDLSKESRFPSNMPKILSVQGEATGVATRFQIGVLF